MQLFKTGLSLIFIFSLLFGGEKIAVATKVIGSVEFVRGKDFAKSLNKGHIVESGDIISTGKGGFVALLFIDDKSALKIKENSEAIISGDKNNDWFGNLLNGNTGFLIAISPFPKLFFNLVKSEIIIFIIYMMRDNSTPYHLVLKNLWKKIT